MAGDTEYLPTQTGSLAFFLPSFKLLQVSYEMFKFQELGLAMMLILMKYKHWPLS